MVGWLVGWLVSWLVGWLVVCLVGCLFGWLVRSTSCPCVVHGLPCNETTRILINIPKNINISRSKKKIIRYEQILRSLVTPIPRVTVGDRDGYGTPVCDLGRCSVLVDSNPFLHIKQQLAKYGSNRQYGLSMLCHSIRPTHFTLTSVRYTSRYVLTARLQINIDYSFLKG